MIGFSRSAQTVLVIMMLIFTILLVVLQSLRLHKARNKNTSLITATKFTKQDLALWVSELLTVLCLFGIVVAMYFLYWDYIPANSPGCLPYISEFGVIASAVDPSKYAVSPAATYPAISFANAVAAYKSSPNGFATGYFAWDGVSVTILNHNAYVLGSGAIPGTNWVFQDLSTTSAVVY